MATRPGRSARCGRASRSQAAARCCTASRWRRPVSDRMFATCLLLEEGISFSNEILWKIWFVVSRYSETEYIGDWDAFPLLRFRVRAQRASCLSLPIWIVPHPFHASHQMINEHMNNTIMLILMILVLFNNIYVCVYIYIYIHTLILMIVMYYFELYIYI